MLKDMIGNDKVGHFFETQCISQQ